MREESAGQIDEHVGAGGVSHPLILAGEQSSLLRRIAATKSVSLCVAMKS
jgi:hypothetical protein